MNIHLIDGTYELIRYFFGAPSHITDEGKEVGAVRAVANSMLTIVEEGATHIGIATDHVITSFRNVLFDGYKDGSDLDPVILGQFSLLEEVLEAIGFTVFPMIKYEADDGLGAAAHKAIKNPHVEEVIICTPDKDLGQCLTADEKIIQYDRRKKERITYQSVIEKFGVPVVVAINDYVTDTPNEHEQIINFCKNLGVQCKISSHWEKGGEGATDLAEEVARIADSNSSDFKTLYESEMSLWDKTEYIAKNIYGASEIIADKKVRNQFKKLEDDGFGSYPICMAKTQYSFSTDPLLMGAPSGHDVPIKEVRLSAGAEFIVVVCGEIMTMPGLPRVPAAEAIGLDEHKEIKGLF